ncbi:hypothetical protein QQS21_009106 [Conoideocrella luteorostrata]|uniref:Uncharacterized protein n=1 Tax=Conoideocrella luteorostrata TaxID=1105319 RepID=A0AAJ0CIF0_9HYPO|nr:hypothetical protein QQS21_009106 [Conoideocrella luteorostrata]
MDPQKQNNIVPNTPKKDSTKLTDEQLMGKYNLRFRVGKESWHGFECLFEPVEQIATITYDHWKEDRPTSAWRVNVRRQADVLVRESKVLYDTIGDKTEIAWRPLENEMFKRLRFDSTWYDQSIRLH